MVYKIKQTLISQEEIHKRVQHIAEEIEKDYNHEPIVLIIVLKGSFVFAADLIRHMKGDIKWILFLSPATAIKLKQRER
jgi:hypoxanthine phosphoribosyltransferase